MAAPIRNSGRAGVTIFGVTLTLAIVIPSLKLRYPSISMVAVWLTIMQHADLKTCIKQRLRVNQQELCVLPWREMQQAGCARLTPWFFFW